MPVSDTDNCKIHGKIAKADDLNFNILDNFIIINGAFGLVSLYLLAIDLDVFKIHNLPKGTKIQAVVLIGVIITTGLYAVTIDYFIRIFDFAKSIEYVLSAYQ